MSMQVEEQDCTARNDASIFWQAQSIHNPVDIAAFLNRKDHGNSHFSISTMSENMKQTLSDSISCTDQCMARRNDQSAAPLRYILSWWPAMAGVRRWKVSEALRFYARLRHVCTVLF